MYRPRATWGYPALQFLSTWGLGRAPAVLHKGQCPMARQIRTPERSARGAQCQGPAFLHIRRRQYRNRHSRKPRLHHKNQSSRALCYQEIALLLRAYRDSGFLYIPDHIFASWYRSRLLRRAPPPRTSALPSTRAGIRRRSRDSRAGGADFSELMKILFAITSRKKDSCQTKDSSQAQEPRPCSDQAR